MIILDYQVIKKASLIDTGVKGFHQQMRNELFE